MRSVFFTIACFLLLAASAVVHATLKAREHTNRILSFEQQLKINQYAFYEAMYYNASDVKINTRHFVDEQLDTIDIKRLFFGKEQKLVLRLKENHCMDCVDSILFRLLPFAGTPGDNKIILLGSYTDINYMIRLKQVRDLPFEIYNSTTPLFEGEKNIDQQPFFFLLDSTLDVKCLFPIKTELSVMTDIYLKTMKQHLDKRYHAK